MSAETLVTAAHRLNRFFKVDMAAGGLVVDETLEALRILQREVELAEKGHKPADEHLMVAARAAARDLHSDMTRHGGMVAVSTEIAFDTLDKAIRAVGGREAA
ncbi:hypothetical protein [Methylobacterium sp. D54C]